MGLRPRFTKQDVSKIIAGRMRRIEAAIINALQFLGEQCVINARDLGSYKDRTGNLRSSVGYVVVANGRVVGRNFKGDSEGVRQGEKLANDIAKGYLNGYALIVVAGMNYAAYVEARGYNVLSSAELLAEREMPQILKRLRRNISKMQ